MEKSLEQRKPSGDTGRRRAGSGSRLAYQGHQQAREQQVEYRWILGSRGRDGPAQHRRVVRPESLVRATVRRCAIGNPRLRRGPLRSGTVGGRGPHSPECRGDRDAGSITCVGSTLTVDISIGKHVIINPDCTIGHDCIIEDFVTLPRLPRIREQPYRERGFGHRRGHHREAQDRQLLNRRGRSRGREGHPGRRKPPRVFPRKR